MGSFPTQGVSGGAAGGGVRTVLAIGRVTPHSAGQSFGISMLCNLESLATDEHKHKREVGNKPQGPGSPPPGHLGS